MENIKIKEVDYGLGTNYGEYIEINKNLPKDLKEMILNHELNHSKKEYQGLNSWKLETPTLNFKLLWWMIRNPKSFYNFWPIRRGFMDKKLLLIELVLIFFIGYILYFLFVLNLASKDNFITSSIFTLLIIITISYALIKRSQKNDR